VDNNNLDLFRHVIEEGFGNADLYVIDQLMSDNLIEHQFGARGGKEGVKKQSLVWPMLFLIGITNLLIIQ
jgi:hypothetical protein